MYIAILAIVGCISIVSILLYRNWIKKSAAIYELPEIKIKVSSPDWGPADETTEGLKIIKTPSAGYTVEDTAAPPKLLKSADDLFIVPPGTLGEGGDVREVMPYIEFIGPEPGSAASEACDE